MGSPNNTIQTKVIDQDGYEVSLKIIKSINPVYNHLLLPVFVFIPPMAGSVQDVQRYEELAKLIVMESGRMAAVILTNTDDVFDYFAALKWIFRNGEEVGLDVSRVAVVGCQSGANVATLLSLMAYHDGLPEISIQVLIDPQFFEISLPRSFDCPNSSLTSDIGKEKWLTMDCVFRLPLELTEEELFKMPPTSLLFPDKSWSGDYIKDYCIKLFKAGTTVSYVRGESTADNGNSLLQHTVAQLVYFLFPGEK